MIYTNIDQFILENNETSFINLSVSYLQNLFNEINRECFNNELNQIPIKLSNSKSTLGYFKFNRVRSTREVTPICISISKMFNYTEQKIRNIMAHEMIHYWVAINYNENEHHGYNFIQNMNRLNKMGYSITVKDDEADLNIPTNITSMKYLITGLYQAKELAYTLITPATDIREVLGLFNKYQITDIKVYKTTSGKTLQLTTSRKPKVSIIKKQYAYIVNDIINDTENTSLYNI